MPPRNIPPRGRGSGQRGAAPSSGSSSRGRGAGFPSTGGGPSQVVKIPDHVQGLGVKRRDYGKAGRPINIIVNAYEVEFEEKTLYHYDDITPSSVSARFNMKLIRHLQTVVAPDVFNPPAVYDGKKNLYAARRLPLAANDAQQFDVPPPDAPAGGASKRASRTYKVKLTLANQINAAVLRAYLDQRQSHDESVLTAITALNIATRMKASEDYAFTTRSFFTQQGKKSIGRGIELWRGLFQSLRPALGRLIMNVDTATGIMYKAGPLIDLCLEYLGISGPNLTRLSPPTGLNEVDRRRLQSFISRLRVAVRIPTNPPRDLRTGTINSISKASAANTRFQADGQTITIPQYFKQKYSFTVRNPQLFCVQIGSKDALYPAELCYVIEGQSVPRDKLPNDKTKDVVEFSSVPPNQRFMNIEQGTSSVLAFEQSNYIRQFGMKIETGNGLMRVRARVLPPTSVSYYGGSFQPRDGSWNLAGRRFYKPEAIKKWAIVIYDPGFRDHTVRQMVQGIITECKNLGMTVLDHEPLVKWEDGQGDTAQQLRQVYMEVSKKETKAVKKDEPPNLIFIVLPEGGDEIYRRVKHVGDVVAGFATQCVKSKKAYNARPQYWANVLAKVNAKLGGINHVLDKSGVPLINDTANPVIVMGADVMHPGASNRPSYAALVGSVDSLVSKYVSTMRVQASRQELIEDLEDMCKYIFEQHKSYKQHLEKTAVLPKKLIFFRDGVSEGQFGQVLSDELPRIKNACKQAGINPKITLLVVGKRHHFRFRNPEHDKGHTPSGTVVDTEITNPIDFEWYTQSHKPLLGTSRPAHYTVLHDENALDSDKLQAFAYAMCHVYARSTGAVSIPAPVYYADIICARAPIHYAPGKDPSTLSETMTNKSDSQMLEVHKNNFRPLSVSQSRKMYFM